MISYKIGGYYRMGAVIYNVSSIDKVDNVTYSCYSPLKTGEFIHHTNFTHKGLDLCFGEEITKEDFLLECLIRGVRGSLFCGPDNESKE